MFHGYDSIRTVADIERYCYSLARVLAYRGSAELVDLADWLLRKLEVPAAYPVDTNAKSREETNRDSAADLYRLAAPQRDGSDDIVRIFSLSPAASLPEMIVAMHEDAHIQKVGWRMAPPALVLRGSPAQLAGAERMIEEKEKTSPARSKR